MVGKRSTLTDTVVKNAFVLGDRHSGVPRVSSARGPMLASAPPPELAPPPCHIGPTRLAPPPFAPPFGKNKPFGPGKKIDKQKNNNKKNQKPEKEKKDPLMHRERGALGSAAFKISPYKLGGRPLQGSRPGAMAPLPPPRYATG